MEYPTVTAPFDEKIENVHLHCKNLSISIIDNVLLNVFPEVSPYTSIWHELNVNGLPTYKDLMGTLTIFFRNQGSDERMALSLEIHVRVKANGDTAAADTFCKVIQYFFAWTDRWVKENDLRDSHGLPFVMPTFLYSRGHFEQALPQ